MRRVWRYLVMFIWVTVFFYYFNMYIPKNFLYFLIGLPVSILAHFSFMEKKAFNGFLII